jgi:hypothetical protein
MGNPGCIADRPSAGGRMGSAASSMMPPSGTARARPGRLVTWDVDDDAGRRSATSAPPRCEGYCPLDIPPRQRTIRARRHWVSPPMVRLLATV